MCRDGRGTIIGSPPHSAKESPVELPRTLHGQLYLLAYDRNRRRFDFDRANRWNNRWRFGFALHSAMLTDLYLTGYLEDKDGRAHRVKARHDDPVLCEALEGAAGREWARLIVDNGRHACQVVRDQLEDSGWISRKQRRTLGILPGPRPRLYDEDMVGGLAERVTGALHNIIDDRPADPRPLALGLIAVQAQMPVVAGLIENPRHRDQLCEMTLAAIEPILGLHHAIEDRFTGMRSGGCGGGCGGGGCGAGGCGGGGP
jgi:Golgi phosphoprotein 3 (GPP34)